MAAERRPTWRPAATRRRCRRGISIPPAAFASPEDVGRFVDVSSPCGRRLVLVGRRRHRRRLRQRRPARDPDVQLRQLRPDAAVSAWRGRDLRRSGGAGGTRRSSSAGSTCCRPTTTTTAARTCSCCAAGGSWRSAKSLLRNNCDGTFTDVTAASGLATPATSTQTAVWTDIDNDGWVDLFVGNEDAPSQLFRNRGDGTFEDIAAAAGVARTAFTKAVARRRLRQRRLSRTSTSRTCAAATCSIATTATGPSPRWRPRPACPAPTAASRPGSSTTTTTAGTICSSAATSCRSRRTARSYLRLPLNADDA